MQISLHFTFVPFLKLASGLNWLYQTYQHNLPVLLLSSGTAAGDAEFLVSTHFSRLSTSGSDVLSSVSPCPLGKVDQTDRLGSADSLVNRLVDPAPPHLPIATADWGPHLVVCPSLCLPSWRSRLSAVWPGIRILCIAVGYGASFHDRCSDTCPSFGDCEHDVGLEPSIAESKLNLMATITGHTSNLASSLLGVDLSRLDSRTSFNVCLTSYTVLNANVDFFCQIPWNIIVFDQIHYLIHHSLTFDSFNSALSGSGFGGRTRISNDDEGTDEADEAASPLVSAVSVPSVSCQEATTISTGTSGSSNSFRNRGSGSRRKTGAVVHDANHGVAWPGSGAQVTGSGSSAHTSSSSSIASSSWMSGNCATGDTCIPPNVRNVRCSILEQITTGSVSADSMWTHLGSGDPPLCRQATSFTCDHGPESETQTESAQPPIALIRPRGIQGFLPRSNAEETIDQSHLTRPSFSSTACHTSLIRHLELLSLEANLVANKAVGNRLARQSPAVPMLLAKPDWLARLAARLPCSRQRILISGAAADMPTSVSRLDLLAHLLLTPYATPNKDRLQSQTLMRAEESRQPNSDVETVASTFVAALAAAMIQLNALTATGQIPVQTTQSQEVKRDPCEAYATLPSGIGAGTGLVNFNNSSDREGSNDRPSEMITARQLSRDLAKV
ncbi:unnamed protein product [Protopolystoma xenopodis]|uniref:Uncharacterized protein n=1 Tax=Protopolystoma xenopodis TaxID=117903 RepID=A0A448WB32_9PLAT|nr:unnamed protein product [Protopolystoma xenopodis]